MTSSALRQRVPASAMLDPKIVWPAFGQAFVKLDPRLMIGNPVMFVVEAGSVPPRAIGIALFVSKDGAATWSRVALPALPFPAQSRAPAASIFNGSR